MHRTEYDWATVMDASLKMLIVQADAGRARGNIQADAAADRARGNIKADELGACPQSSHLNVHQVLQVDGRRRPIEQVSGGPGALWVAVELLLGPVLDDSELLKHQTLVLLGAEG